MLKIFIDLYFIGETYSTKYYCNAKVAGLDKIFVQWKFIGYMVWDSN